MMTEKFVVQMVIHGTIHTRAVQDPKLFRMACLIPFPPSKKWSEWRSIPNRLFQSRFIRSFQPYSSTCIGGEAADCQEAQKMWTPIDLGQVVIIYKYIKVLVKE